MLTCGAMRIALIPFEANHPEHAGMRLEKFSRDAHYAGYIIVDDSVSQAILEVIKTEAKLGKPILGIGKGAKLLVETGLVPGIENDKVGITLIDSNPVVSETIFFRLSDSYQLNAFTQYLKPKDVLSISDTGIEKYFVIPPALLAEMQLLGMNVFHYCDAEGKLTDQIAAVSNKAGNIMAIVPHVEKASKNESIFQSMHDYIQAGYVQRVVPLNYYPRERG